MIPEESPYNTMALNYLMAGWIPFPVPYGEKSPPPKGVTGHLGVDPTEEDTLGVWFDQGGNIASRMPANIIGIDVDGVEGYKTFKDLENKLGALPIHVVITSRVSLSEGFTAFFEVPVGMQFEQLAGRHIDIIQNSHRYSVMAPSLHPEGRFYSWRTYEGGVNLPFVPEVDSFEGLPQAWFDFLLKKEETPGEGVEWGVGSTPGEGSNLTGGVGCAMMKSILKNKLSSLRSGGEGRHDAMVKATWAIVCESHKGHQGGVETLETYFKIWSTKFSEEEALNRSLRHEFDAAVLSAKNKQGGSQMSTCGCGRGSGGVRSKNRSIVSNQRMWK